MPLTEREKRFSEPAMLQVEETQVVTVQKMRPMSVVMEDVDAFEPGLAAEYDHTAPQFAAFVEGFFKDAAIYSYGQVVNRLAARLRRNADQRATAVAQLKHPLLEQWDTRGHELVEAEGRKRQAERAAEEARRNG